MAPSVTLLNQKVYVRNLEGRRATPPATAAEGEVLRLCTIPKQLVLAIGSTLRYFAAMTAPTIPVIFSPRVEPVRVGPWGRVLSLGVCAFCLWLMITAIRLTPSPTGMGTHTQLGLDECQFALRTGLPCPSCGMTTSFAWFARANFPASVYVQPMGFLLALATVVTFWAGFYIVMTGRSVYRLVSLGPSRYYVPLFMTLSIAAWAWKIFIHLHGIDGWRS